jgi:uncharacterized membrane protein YkvA (DUF1232 family)
MSFYDRLRRVASLMTDPRTPALPRIAVALAAIYLIWPVDLLPDFAPPLIGYFDDLVTVWLALRWLIKSGTAAGVATPQQTPHR